MSTGLLWPLAALVATSGLSFGQEADPLPVSFFNDIRPLLQAHCQGCHQPAKDSGDVMLMTRADLLLEVDGMALVVPGQPGASLLIDVVSPLGDIPAEMPEDGPPLLEQQRALLTRWIAEGAIDDSPDHLALLPTVEHPPSYGALPVTRALAISPDGKELAVSGRHEVLLHDLTALLAGQPVPPRRLIGLSSRIESISFSPTGSLLAVAGGVPAGFGELQLWRVADGKLLRSMPLTHDTLRGLSWSPDGKLVAFGCSDRTLRAIDAKTGEQVLFQGAHEDWVLDTTFSRDGSHLISVGVDRSAKLTKVETEQFIDNITSITPGAIKGGLLAVERHPELEEVLVGGADGEPKLYRIYREKRREIGDDFNLVRAYAPLLGRITDVAWAQDGSRLFVTASLSLHGKPKRGGALRAYDLLGEVLWTSRFHKALYALAADPMGTCIAAAGFGGKVRLFHPETGEVLTEFVPVPIETTASASTPEGTTPPADIGPTTEPAQGTPPGRSKP